MGSSGTEFIGQSSTTGVTRSCRSIGCRKHNAVGGGSCWIDATVMALRSRILKFHDRHEHKEWIYYPYKSG